METNAYLKEHYEKGGENGRLLSRHGRIEFLTTVRYVEKYLHEGMKIIEIGAGTGRYSHYFAKQGYTVDAVELINYNIEVFKQNTVHGEAVTIKQGNALNLSYYPDNTYDITLLLGPMYHLYTKEDQQKALSEAIRITKKGGIVFASYCNNDATIVQFGFVKGNILHEMEKGMIDPITFKCKSTPVEVFELYTKSEIDELIAHFKVKRLHYVGTDMATNFIKDTVDAMDDKTYDVYLRYHFSICERSDLIGATHHMLDISKRNDFYEFTRFY